MTNVPLPGYTGAIIYVCPECWGDQAAAVLVSDLLAILRDGGS